MAKEISYYSGGSGEDSWSEGSTEAGAFFRAPSTGEYSLEIFAEGGTGYRGRNPSRAPVVVILPGRKVALLLHLRFVSGRLRRQLVGTSPF